MDKSCPVFYHGTLQEYFFRERCFVSEWWNSSDDPHVSVVRARVLPGVTTRLHRLNGIMERYVILEGQGLAKIGREALRVVVPGDVILIPPGVAQRISNPGVSDLLFLVVCTPRFIIDAYEELEEGNKK